MGLVFIPFIYLIKQSKTAFNQYSVKQGQCKSRDMCISRIKNQFPWDLKLRFDFLNVIEDKNLKFVVFKILKCVWITKHNLSQRDSGE